MLRYIIQRLLYFIPILVLFAVFAFILFDLIPGKPSEHVFRRNSESGIVANGNNDDNRIHIWEKEQGLHLPLFYMTVSGKYFPDVEFNTDNRFHRWMFGNPNNSTYGLICGDLGKSYITGQSVSEIIAPKLLWSLLLSLLSVVLAFGLSIPISVYSTTHQGGIIDKSITILLYVLFSIPVFFLAVVLMMLFANPSVVQVLPLNGVGPLNGYANEISLWQKIWQSIPYLVMPVISYTYSSIAVISRMNRAVLLDVLSSDYVRTARAKGLTEKRILYRHALVNAMLPMISVFASILPATVAGSVIIETIFTIPGMGLETYSAIANRDFPVMLAVFLITGFITILTYFLADVISAFIDPRFKLKLK